MQITLGDFIFIYQFSSIPSIVNKTIQHHFCILVKKQEHLSPLRALFARQQSNIATREKTAFGVHSEK